MFCRSCGNKLADNAKFCNVCGTKIAAPAQNAPTQNIPSQNNIPQQVPTQNIPIQQNMPQQPQTVRQPQQPYQLNYVPPMAQQQTPVPPMAQPYPQQSAAPALEKPVTTGKIIAMLGWCVSCFLLFTTLFKVFHARSFIRDYTFGTASYLKDLGKSASYLKMNVFSFTFKHIGDDFETAVLFSGLWLHVLFECIACIVLLIALISLFSKHRSSEAALWRRVKASAVLSFLGNCCSVLAIIIDDVKSNLDADKGFFEDWPVKPGFLAYFFIGLALVTAIICGIMSRRAERSAVSFGAVY